MPLSYFKEKADKYWSLVENGFWFFLILVS